MDTKAKPRWGRRLSLLALVLSLGGVTIALVAAVGTGAGAWTYSAGLSPLRYALLSAAGGGLLAIAAWLVGRRDGGNIGWMSPVALLVALLFLTYLGNMIVTARSLPAIHDVMTNLDDPPRFTHLAVRPDNLEKVPDEGKPELASLAPEARWKALHRRAYGDLRPIRLTTPPSQVLQRAEQIAGDRGWAIAAVDHRGGTLEATATTFFFRFKDDVVVRVRPDPARAGGSIVDMRSVSRVGVSDVGVNAKRIRAFLSDLAEVSR